MNHKFWSKKLQSAVQKKKKKVDRHKLNRPGGEGLRKFHELGAQTPISPPLYVGLFL